MSNIHTLNDTRLREAAEARQRQALEQESSVANQAAQQQNLFSFIPGQGDVPTKDPRNETFFEMWKFTFCPRFQFCSAIFFICMIELAFFIASLIYTGVTKKEIDPHFFLGIHMVTLQKFGMRMPWLIKQYGQVHRFIVPTFLHFGFSHIVITTLLQISVGTVIESFMGTGRFIIYYAFVCIGSNIFGALCSPQYAVGSDPVIFGFLATLFSVMLVYWERIPGTNCTKVCQTLMMVMVFIVVAMLLTTSAQQYSFYTSRQNVIFPDLYGSIGGFLYGYLGGMMLLPIDTSSAGRFGRERIIQLTGLILILALTLILLLVFFLGNEPKVSRTFS